jgi:predicted nucleic acid-binding protein
VIVYLDTSSYVKLFLLEAGSDLVESLVEGADAVVTSVVTYAETRSALARAKYLGRLGDAAYEAVVTAMENQWTTLTTPAVQHDLAHLAGELAEKHRLRGFDAVHLATAVRVKLAIAAETNFSAWDQRLMSAAEAEGLTAAHAIV